MKKIFTIVISLIICFSTIGCSCKGIEPVVLEESQYAEEEGKIEFLSSFDFIQEKIDAKSTFVFYMYGAGCSACHDFTPILREYVKEKKIIMYATEVKQIDKVNPDLKNTLKCTPAIAIIKEGNLHQYIDSCNEEQGDYFMSKEGFGEWFESYVELKG